MVARAGSTGPARHADGADHQLAPKKKMAHLSIRHSLPALSTELLDIGAAYRIREGRGLRFFHVASDIRQRERRGGGDENKQQRGNHTFGIHDSCSLKS